MTRDRASETEALTEPLDRGSPTPLFLQIRQRLLAEIASWPDASRRFHGDGELAGRFGVSKMTVRHALANLVADGYLERTRGRGTFVREVPIEERLSPELDIDRQYDRAGRPQAVRVLSFRTVAERSSPQEDFPAVLKPPLLHIRRLRSVSTVPVAVDDRWIPALLAREAGFTRRNAAGSIVDRLRSRCSLARADWRIRVDRTDAAIGALLQVERGTALLAREMTYVDGDERPILSGRTVHRWDLAQYTVSLPLDPSGSDD